MYALVFYYVFPPPSVEQGRYNAVRHFVVLSKATRRDRHDLN